MRVLHTSDWHLGRQFHGASLLSDQEAAMDRIVALAAEAEVDAVLIAGDLYDRAIPPAEAVQLFNDTLARLSRAGAGLARGVADAARARLDHLALDGRGTHGGGDGSVVVHGLGAPGGAQARCLA